MVLIAAWLLIVASRATCDTNSTPVAAGLQPAEVRDILGEPAGEAQKGKRKIWLYPKGTVEFENGRVVRSDLLSDTAYAEAVARKAREAETRRQAALNAPAAPARKPPTASEPATPPQVAPEERFVRPFIRPEYQNVQYYNNIPVVFEIAKWPPGLQKIYDKSVEVPAEDGERRTTYSTLLYELKKYPPEMLEQTLRCIYMIRNIQGTGTDMDPAALAFHTEGIVLEHTSFLHHEYGHQLSYLFADEFPRAEMSAVSGKYKGHNHGLELNYKDLWKLGYTSNYAMSSVSEDFAEFCDALYLQPVVLFQAMKENPLLAAKFAVVRPFLELVKRRTTGDDAPMDEAYFSRFDRTVWKP